MNNVVSLLYYYIFFTLFGMLPYSFINFYNYCLDQQNRSSGYISFSVQDGLFLSIIGLFLFLEFEFISNVIGNYFRYAPYLPNSTVYTVPLIIISGIAIFILLIWLLLFINRGNVQSTDIYFILSEEIENLIQKVLVDMGWKEIHINKSNPDQLIFTEPDEKYYIQVNVYQIKISARIQSMGINKKMIRRIERNFQRILLKEQTEYKYHDKFEQAPIFIKKYRWLLILSYILIGMAIIGFTYVYFYKLIVYR
jgi:hypothetical protein